MAEHPISVEGLRVRLGGKEIVRGADLLASSGQLHVVAGPNGAGKSTLVRAILGLVPSEGTVTICGTALSAMSHTDRAKAMSYVPQSSALAAALTVEELVAQARFVRAESRSRTRESVARALSRIGIEDLATASYLELSGGERRLALIARAVCTEAPIMVLDEPTASLDIANRLHVLELLKRLAGEGLAIVTVLHDLEDVLRYGDQVTLMRKGRIQAYGAPSEVLTRDCVLETYRVELEPNTALGYALPGEPR